MYTQLTRRLRHKSNTKTPKRSVPLRVFKHVSFSDEINPNGESVNIPMSKKIPMGETNMAPEPKWAQKQG